MGNDELNFYYSNLNYPLPEWQKKLLAKIFLEKLINTG